MGKEIEKVREDEDATELLSTLDEEIGKIRDEVDGIQKQVETERLKPRTGIKEVDEFIEAFESMPTTHLAASSYKNGKHVSGATNDERKASSRGQTGDGQYLAERDGNRVTDGIIEGWERDVIDRALAGDKDVTIVIKGGTFYFYYTFEDFVGYSAPDANRTKRVRVEWSSGTVHSHPRGAGM